ncbi:MAG: SPFH domain-containing protein [Gammaproteobacteria bacterium]|nr:SPFH domain-containing protein [Gammaproteobacteria bacterium]
MGIFNRFHSEFIDIIEWTQTDRETMAYRFPRYKNEIKYGAKLTVREGQCAILVNEGKIADVFQPGIYELETANVPILSTLQNWHHGFESPFKAEVYFFNTTDFVDLKWGTKQAITISDSDFGVVRVRAFGSYTLGVNDPALLLKELVGTDGNFEISEISSQLSNSIVSQLPNVLANAKVSILEMPAHHNELADNIKNAVSDEFTGYGLQIEKLYLESVSLPENVQKVLDQKTGMNIIGDDLNDYAKFQAAQGMANGNAGSDMASAGIGMAIGMELGKSMTKDMQDKEEDSLEKRELDTPPPAPKIYYLMLVGERVGPMSEYEVYQHLASGEADADTLIWRKGMPEWSVIESIGDIDLSNIPPPCSQIVWGYIINILSTATIIK